MSSTDGTGDGRHAATEADRRMLANLAPRVAARVAEWRAAGLDGRGVAASCPALLARRHLAGLRPSGCRLTAKAGGWIADALFDGVPEGLHPAFGTPEAEPVAGRGPAVLALVDLLATVEAAVALDAWSADRTFRYRSVELTVPEAWMALDDGLGDAAGHLAALDAALGLSGDDVVREAPSAKLGPSLATAARAALRVGASEWPGHLPDPAGPEGRALLAALAPRAAALAAEAAATYGDLGWVLAHAADLVVEAYRTPATAVGAFAYEVPGGWAAHLLHSPTPPGRAAARGMGLAPGQAFPSRGDAEEYLVQTLATLELIEAHGARAHAAAFEFRGTTVLVRTDGGRRAASADAVRAMLAEADRLLGTTGDDDMPPSPSEAAVEAVDAAAAEAVRCGMGYWPESRGAR